MPLSRRSYVDLDSSTCGRNGKGRLSEDHVAKCMICADALTIDGSHRVVSLPCGHVFGLYCIEKWIDESRTCPQCSRRVRKKDLRPLYLNAMTVLDEPEQKIIEKRQQRHMEEKYTTMTAALHSLMKRHQNLKEEYRQRIRIQHHHDMDNHSQDKTKKSSKAVPRHAMMRMFSGAFFILYYALVVFLSLMGLIFLIGTVMRK